jgi:hypothetical protein
MIYKIFIIMMLVICSMPLSSCTAITAQNITHTGSGQGMNGNPGMNGGGGMNGGPGGPGMNGNVRGNRMANADLTGKIVSVDGSSIKIQLAEQTQDNKSSNSNGGNQNTKDNQNNDNNRQTQGGFPGGMSEQSYTGAIKTITVNDNVKISQWAGMRQQNKSDNSKSTIKVSDLKKDQVIMIWYKANTKTVERISIIQS